MSINYLFKGIVILTVLIAVIFVYFLYQTPKANQFPEYEIKHIKIGNIELIVKVADTPQKREIGLMNVSYIQENHGMLFIFDNPGYHSFWMKNTLIPLEIFFINEKYEIIDIQNMSPCMEANCKIYSPPSEILYAIEVNENFSRDNNVKIGEKVTGIN